MCYRNSSACSAGRSLSSCLRAQKSSAVSDIAHVTAEETLSMELLQQIPRRLPLSSKAGDQVKNSVTVYDQGKSINNSPPSRP